MVVGVALLSDAETEGGATDDSGGAASAVMIGGTSPSASSNSMLYNGVREVDELRSEAPEEAARIARRLRCCSIAESIAASIAAPVSGDVAMHVSIAARRSLEVSLRLHGTDHDIVMKMRVLWD